MSKQSLLGASAPSSEKVNKPLHMKAPHEVRAELDPEGAERKKQIDALRMRMKAVDLE